MLRKIKKIIKALVPPIAIFAFRRLWKPAQNQITWSGNYKTWTDAQNQCSGYDSEQILLKVKTSLLKVKNGEAVYERDSVLFDEIQYNFALLAGLQKAALENERELSVLDFGGSLGSSYYQNKVFLNSLNKLTWGIVEQAHFVACGKEFFEDNELRFFSTIEECQEKIAPNVLLLSSVLQYLEHPYEWLARFTDLNIPYIIIDRTSFIEGTQDRLTIQKVPGSVYEASYRCWFLNEKKIMDVLLPKYTLIASFDALDSSNIRSSYYKGFILKRTAC